MVYFENAAIRIRDLEHADAQVITDGEIAQGWHQTVDKYLNRLRDQAEAIAARYGDTVYLGVGLHNGYGSAQRMYVKRGYVPDGSGVWYGDQNCPQYAPCCNDDDLVLYLSKKLK